MKIPTDGNLLSPMGDIDFAIAIGAIGGYSSFRKFGTNPAVGVGREDIWGAGGVMVWPDSAGAASVVSDSAADTDGGTGAHAVMVQGLDGDYNQVQEIVTLSGLTPAVTTQTFLRVYRMFVLECGSGDTNAGNITASVGGNVQAYLEATEGQTAGSHYTVPAGHSLIINFYGVGVGRMAGSSDANIEAQIRVYDETVANASKHQGWRSISNLFVFNGEEHVNIRSTTVLPEKTDLRGQIVSSVATQAHAIYGGYLVNQVTQGSF